jgi:hypothetical protein
MKEKIFEETVAEIPPNLLKTTNPNRITIF